MKPFKQMTEKEFHNLKVKAKLVEHSPFAKFCFGTKGFCFKTVRGQQLDKWEVWEMGYHDAQSLIENKTRIIAKSKEDETKTC